MSSAIKDLYKQMAIKDIHTISPCKKTLFFHVCAAGL